MPNFYVEKIFFRCIKNGGPDQHFCRSAGMSLAFSATKFCSDIRTSVVDRSREQCRGIDLRLHAVHQDQPIPHRFRTILLDDGPWYNFQLDFSPIL